MTVTGCDAPEIQLVPYEQALQNLLDHASAINETESVEVNHCLNRILAKDLVSQINVPPASNSSMDGYALRVSDINMKGATTLAISQRITAGNVGVTLAPKTAARIFTGAPIPSEADAVIMQEQVEVHGENISFSMNVSKGQNIRLAGEDIKTNDAILQKGVKLRAQELGLAASIGEVRIIVNRKVKVGIFFTGDELVEPGQPLSPGKIYDSNRYTIIGLLHTLDCEIIDLGIVGDTLQQTKDAILKAADKADLVITSGGVSVGEEDHVRIALEQLGDLYMWRLKIKPGKPLAFGKVNSTAFIGMPGNPVSTFATFCLFVSPFIKKLQGRNKIQAEAIPVTSSFEWLKPDSRREFIRARLETDENNQITANIYHHQGSGVLMSTSWADGLVEVPEQTVVNMGDIVSYIPFNEMLG